MHPLAIVLLATGFAAGVRAWQEFLAVRPRPVAAGAPEPREAIIDSIVVLDDAVLFEVSYIDGRAGERSFGGTADDAALAALHRWHRAYQRVNVVARGDAVLLQRGTTSVRLPVRGAATSALGT